jgi:protein tyrosine/serine phosphatase
MALMRMDAGALWLLMLLASAGHAQEVPDKGPRYKELPNFHQVNARLFRGGQPRTGGLRKLASLGVKTVINLRDDDERARAEGEEAKAAGLRYFNVPFGRLGRPEDAEVEHVLALIDAPENGVVFLHCAKGQDRTGTVVAVYRITHDGWTSEQAKREANRYGMKFWQRGMKDYISDYYRDHVPRTRPGRPR